MDFQYNKEVRKNSPNRSAGIIKCPNKLIVAIYFLFFFDNKWWTCFVIFVVKYNKYLSICYIFFISFLLKGALPFSVGGLVADIGPLGTFESDYKFMS